MDIITAWADENLLVRTIQSGPTEETSDAEGRTPYQVEWSGEPPEPETVQVDLTDPDNPVLVAADSATLDAVFLATDRVTAVNRVNARAAAILGAVASPHAPQVAIYEAKEAEATAYQADASPDPADYPLLEMGRAVEGRTMAEEAAAVLAEAAQWKAAGAAVDAIRRAANKAIGQATTRAEVQAVLDGLTWPDLGQ